MIGCHTVAAHDILDRFVIEIFGAPDAIGMVDETGLLKKGDKSAGGQHQYTGTASKWAMPKWVSF